MFDLYKELIMTSTGCDDYTTLLRSVNCSPAVSMLAMEMLESIGWIVLGFVPTLAAMEAAWRIGKGRLSLPEVDVR